MKIEFDIPRPFATLCFLAAIGWGIYTYQLQQRVALLGSVLPPQSAVAGTADTPVHGTGSYSDAVAAVSAEGGDTTPPQQKVKEAEDNALMARTQQELLKRKADILRGEMKVLEAEKKSLGDTVSPTLEEQFRQSSLILSALMQDQSKAEQFLLTSLNEIWEAQGRAISLGEGLISGIAPDLAWPVQPLLGISATFHDSSYKARFGFAHDAIDIPTPQGTIVRAAADGVVKDVVDHGLGFNYITIQHSGGESTLYGHINKFIAHVGDVVKAGDPIGYSGGRPGTLGAGLSTGPHLHFGVFKSGAAVDPEPLLPSNSSIN